LPTLRFFPELQASKTYPFAQVRMDFKPDIRARIYRLTSQIVDEELQIVVAGWSLVRSSASHLGIEAGFSISAFDVEEAKALVRKLREGGSFPICASCEQQAKAGLRPAKQV
jgi:hypothetical protein